MNNYTVNVFRAGRNSQYLVAVHHAIRADSAASAVEVARMFHPPKVKGYTFEAEVRA